MYYPKKETILFCLKINKQTKQQVKKYGRLWINCAFWCVYYVYNFHYTGNLVPRRSASCKGKRPCGAQGHSLASCGWTYSLGRSISCFVCRDFGTANIISAFPYTVKPLHFLTFLLCTGCLSHGRCSFWLGRPGLEARRFRLPDGHKQQEVNTHF